MEAYTKGSQRASGFPDVCRPPVPGGPVPVPYPTLKDVHVGRFKGSGKKVKIGKKKTAVSRSSHMPKSKGDEPGTRRTSTCQKCGAKTHKPAILPLSASGRGSARVEVCVECYKKETGGYPLPAIR